MQRADLLSHPAVLLGRTGMKTDVVGPGGQLEAFDPLVHLFQVPQQRPLPGAVPTPDPPPLEHQLLEGGHVLLVDQVLHRHRNRAAARQNVQPYRRLLPAVEGFEIPLDPRRDRPAEADDYPNEGAGRCQLQGLLDGVGFDQGAPQPAAERHAAKGEHLVERQSARPTTQRGVES